MGMGHLGSRGTFCLCLDHPIVEVSNLDIVHIKPSKNVPVWGLINFSNIKLKWIVEIPATESKNVYAEGLGFVYLGPDFFVHIEKPNIDQP